LDQPQRVQRHACTCIGQISVFAHAATDPAHDAGYSRAPDRGCIRRLDQPQRVQRHACTCIGQITVFARAATDPAHDAGYSRAPVSVLFPMRPSAFRQRLTGQPANAVSASSAKSAVLYSFQRNMTTDYTDYTDNDTDEFGIRSRAPSARAATDPAHDAGYSRAAVSVLFPTRTTSDRHAPAGFRR
jgi:hypothetical protein